ncbi:NAD-dependent epimerase/dehydratase family protein [Synechocystis sp. LEGE 06083]|uniref:NAD-dependent epimerase/dehydratase family protein n=1 Tax=Synechocystis sp. LEGE 06083 TaxID=915336 RepID=UPI00187F7DC9|nr:NAD-dependent epimerase/dehydratase family protein [Synechocystis sp. LEGE 06083]MBE9193754.1 NAD-dependent epimerase/dehydratase family protein [Synechocystis sp. LEGE 06083]
MRILIMGGTRFIGIHLCRVLVAQGHEVVLFNRGNRPDPVNGLAQIHGDRRVPEQLREKLEKEEFDIIFDNNGRELSDTQPLVDLYNGRVKQFVYMSSAGVYQASSQMPHRETDAVDPQSRHKGKFETERYLAQSGIPWTAIRPTYIYGPHNYNALESWFFDRLVRGRAIPIPGNGQYITQLGHVEDLAIAMAKTIVTPAAIGQIYNISGDRYVTMDGLAQACASAVGLDPQGVKLVHYDPKDFDFGKRKAFPLRQQHFFADIQKAQDHLDWHPNYDLVEGLKNSFQLDYLPSGKGEEKGDFDLDEQILAFS